MATSNPKSENVFDCIHYALNYNSDFVLDIIQGTGLTGLYSVSGYTVSDPSLDTWTDEYLAYIYEQLPIPESLYTRKKDDFQKNMKAIVRCVGVMMNQFQLRHIDMPTALGLNPQQWRTWCMQWHMYKRDCELTRTHLLIPSAGCRYESVCLYLETLMRLEVIETETRSGGERYKTVQVSPNPYYCPYCHSKYKSYATVANAAAAIWSHCVGCVETTLMVKDAGPTMPAFTMKIFDTISIMEAKMTETGGLDFEANYEVIFAGLLEEVLEHRLKAFQDLATNLIAEGIA